MGLQGQKNLYLLILALSVFAIAYVQAVPNKRTTEIINGNTKTGKEIEMELAPIMDCIKNTKIIGGLMDNISSIIDDMTSFIPNLKTCMMKYLYDIIPILANMAIKAVSGMNIFRPFMPILENILTS